MNHAARKHDDLGVQDVSERAQAGTQRKAGVMDDLGRLCVARTAQVVHVTADRRTAGVDAAKTLIVHTTNGSARSNRLQMAGTPAGAGNAGGSRALDVAHMAGSTMEALHHAAILDICAADARTDAQLLQEALTVAQKADVIVAALGESSEMSGESSSRTDLNIPDVQQNLLKELLKTGKPVVLVLFTGRPLTLNWEQEHVPAILNVWFGGSEAAYAIGDALFGYVNPGGKLTMTFPKNVGQIPLYYAHKNTGRPLKDGKWFEKFRSNYLDVDNDPLYPFGYGLSYTTFSYSDIDLSHSSMDMNGSLTAAVEVTNTGTWPGSEVVQLYIRDVVGSSTRPVKELKGFQKIFLEPGEMKIVRFKIAPEMLRYYNYDLQLVAEPGDFEVMIGTNSRDVKTAKFTLN